MNDDTPLFSHFEPTLRLREHLDQVRAAALFLLAGHSAATRECRPATRRLLEALVDAHDIGKGGTGFQAYIRDPPAWRGTPQEKEHSTLSAAMAILWARSQDWPVLEILALAQAVAGHHAGFVSLERLRERLRPDDGGVLDAQWQGLPLDALRRETGLSLPRVTGSFREAGRWLFRAASADERLEELPLPEAIGFRLWTQFLFSLLLEADKAFLALRREHTERYLATGRTPLDPGLVERHLAKLPDTPLNPLREAIRRRVLANLDGDRRACTLTLPTGVGKTLLAATWALEQRRRLAGQGGTPPRIIVVLPFLSIIDQMDREYRRLLQVPEDQVGQSELLMTSHSLSERRFELEGEELGAAYTRFFLDTWRSEVVITTFDQLLLALFSPRTRHQIRFHRLLDALIVLDEVQTLPCRLWDLVDQALRALSEEGQCRLLMMSATQPALLTGAYELAGDETEDAGLFAQFRRYRIHCRHREELDLDAFIAELLGRLPQWRRRGLRVLITLNTRASARTVWRALNDAARKRLPVWLISADVTPEDRLEKIAGIGQEGRPPCIVVSTQTIEAGVDIDVDLTLRDFAPLDAIIQVAGRCNRHNRLGDYGGRVELLSLRSPRGRRYSELVYDPVLLGVTREILDGIDRLDEDQVLALAKRYFATLKARKDTGARLTQDFAYWREWTQDIHTLLRGEQREQICFIVPDETDDLRTRIQGALDIADHWERREALRQLAPRLQRRTVCLYARRDLHPEDYADPVGPFWLLHPGWYSTEAGLDLGLDREEAACIF
jgi:CRISPR-associated endonuclease/helicase Cas3